MSGIGEVCGEVRPRFVLAARVAEKADAVVLASRTNVPDNLAMDGARDAVLQLKVHLGNRVLGEHRSVGDITCEVTVSAKLYQEEERGGIAKLEVRLGHGALRDVRIAADSTMLRMVKRLMALSLGVHREQLEQRMGLTWPRPGIQELVRRAQKRRFSSRRCLPFLLRPLFFLFLTILTDLRVLRISRLCGKEGRYFQEFNLAHERLACSLCPTFQSVAPKAG